MGRSPARQGRPHRRRELVARWNDELRDLGYRDPADSRAADGDAAGRGSTATRRPSWSSPCLGAKRSAWNAADIRGKVEVLLAQTGLVADPAARIELAEDITARAADAVRPAARPDRCARARPVPDLAAGARGRGRPRHPARPPGRAQPARTGPLDGRGLIRIDPTQAAVVGALAGDGPLVVVEGAAGAGKTTALRSAQALLAQQGHRLVVVTPTLKAAQVAAAETGADGHSAAWLIHQHGWRWDDDGHWTRQPDPTPEPGRPAAAR